MGFSGSNRLVGAEDVATNNLASGEVLRYNSTLGIWNNAPLAVTTDGIADDVVTEAKLQVANQPSNGQVLGWNGSQMAWTTPASGGSGGAAPAVRAAQAVVYASTVPAALRPAASDPAQFVWVCDGTADQDEINAAITAIGAQGKVQLVGSLFTITGSILLTTGVWLAGEGLGTEIKAGSSFNAGMIMLADNTVHATTLSHLSLHGNGQAVHGLHYIANGGKVFTSPPSTNPDPSHVVDSLYIRSCGTATFAGHGMLLEGGDLRSCKYSNIRILGCRGCGVWIKGAADSHFTDIEVGSSGSGGPAYSASQTAPVGHGFFVNGANMMFTACKAWYARGAGFYNVGTRNGYTNCQAQDNYSHGFHVAWGKSSFVNCHADSNGQGNGATVGGATLGRAGFYISTDLVIVTGCMSYDKAQSDTPWEQQWGFQLTSGVVNSRITSCITYGNGVTTVGGSLTGTAGAGTVVDIQADSSGG